MIVAIIARGAPEPQPDGEYYFNITLDEAVPLRGEPATEVFGLFIKKAQGVVDTLEREVARIKGS